MAGSSCNQSSQRAETEEKPVDVKQAIARAEKQDKLILLKFYADWCAPCRALSENIMPQEQVQEALENWTVIDVDVDRQGNYANQYNVSVIPTLVTMSPNGEVLGRIDGMVSAEQLVAFLQAAEKKAKGQAQPATTEPSDNEG
jgi:thiol:disulfide interchange protein